MVMRTIHEQKAGRSGMACGWSSQNQGSDQLLVGILFLVLLHHPLPVVGVTLPSSYSVPLKWQPSVSTNVTGYRVYYGPASGNYTNSILVGNVTTNTVTGLASGATYYFAVTAVAPGGQESPFSNKISYVPGVQTVRIRAVSAGQFVLTVSGLIGHTYQVQATQDFRDLDDHRHCDLGHQRFIEFYGYECGELSSPILSHARMSRKNSIPGEENEKT